MKRPTSRTRPTRRRRSHHALPAPLPVTGCTHPGLPLPMSDASLTARLPLRAFTAAHPGTCHLCHRVIQPGDTIFLPTRDCRAASWQNPAEPYATAWHTCWECGSGLMIFHGYWTINDFAKNPPVALFPAIAPEKECRSGTNGLSKRKAAPAIAPPASGQPGD